MVWFAPRASGGIIKALAPALQLRLEEDLAAAAYDLAPWAFSVFDLVGEAVLRAEPEYQPLQDPVMTLISETNWDAAGRSLSRAQLEELDQIDLLTYSIRQMAPDVLERLTSAVSLDELDRLTQGQWGDPKNIVQIIASLGHGADHQPARAWVERHEQEIQHLPARIVPIAPAVAVKVAARGGRVEIDVDHGLRWNESAEALGALLAVDKTAARLIAESAEAEIVEGISLEQANMIDGLEDFIGVLDAIDSTLLTRYLGVLDPSAVRQSWLERLRGSAEEVAAVNLLIDRSLRTEGPIKAVAAALREASRT